MKKPTKKPSAAERKVAAAAARHQRKLAAFTMIEDIERLAEAANVLKRYMSDLQGQSDSIVSFLASPYSLHLSTEARSREEAAARAARAKIAGMQTFVYDFAESAERLEKALSPLATKMKGGRK